MIPKSADGLHENWWICTRFSLRLDRAIWYKRLKTFLLSLHFRNIICLHVFFHNCVHIFLTLSPACWDQMWTITPAYSICAAVQQAKVCPANTLPRYSIVMLCWSFYLRFAGYFHEQDISPPRSTSACTILTPPLRFVWPCTLPQLLDCVECCLKAKSKLLYAAQVLFGSTFDINSGGSPGFYGVSSVQVYVRWEFGLKGANIDNPKKWLEMRCQVQRIVRALSKHALDWQAQKGNSHPQKYPDLHF